jgi:polysaccharide biosynthesis transport protein
MSNHLPVPQDPNGTPHPAFVESAGATYRQANFEAGGGGNLRTLWRRVYGSIWRYKWLALLLFVVGTTIGFFASRTMVTPIYATNATLWVDGFRASPAEGPIQSSRMLSAGGWMELVRSFAVLDPVVHELKLYVQPKTPVDSAVFANFELDERPRFDEYRFSMDRSGQSFTLTNAAGEAIQQGRIGEAVGVPAGFRWVPPANLLEPGSTLEFSVVRPQQISQAMARELEVRARDNGNFLALGMVGEDPVRIAATLNAVVDRFVIVAGELKASQSMELTRILEEQLASAAANLDGSEASLQGFRVGTVTLPSERVIQQAPGLQATQGSVFSNYFEMKLERDQLRRDREAIAAALDRTGGPLSVTALEVIPAVRASSELLASLTELASKRAELRTLRAQYTDQYFPVQRLAEEIDMLERQSIPRLASLVVDDIRQREAEMDSRLDAASSELRQIPTRSIEEARHERSVAIADELYRTLRQRYESARLMAVSAVPDVQVLDHARVPSSPTNERERMQLFMMFLLGSIGLAVAAPVLLDRVDSRLRYPEQVTNELGLPILGAVPHIAAGNGRGKDGGRGVSLNAVEALREIRLNVAHAFGAAGPLMATVTSPGAGDGKSFITSNLALAFADLGHRTLIIDGDIRRGQLHRLLGSVRVPGLTDFLSGNATVEEIVQATSYDSLDVIACGTRMQAGPELLGSSAMVNLIRDLRGSYDVILVDSPPLGAGVDPFLLSTLTGNALMVLRTGRTDREFASAKLELLDRLPVRMLGAVLNDVPVNGAYRYYSYVSGYSSENEELEAGGAPRQLQGV